jgi:uncharacterized protein (DUF1697 family)
MRYAAFVRGINVGGRKLVAMADLAAAFSSAEASNVKTYSVTGNVVFDAPRRSIDRLAQDLGSALQRRLKLETLVMVRTAEALDAALRLNPFATQKAGSGKQYVSFLASEPAAALRVPQLSPAGNVKLVAVLGRELFSLGWTVGAKIGFPNEFVEKTTALAATTRTFAVATKVLALCSE